ncbi:MAG: outer membrane beta-barrel protein [Acidobacteria bacterium]|nr:outer membrane beta-barrel protein [Acidobacteriota bacterium]
MRKYLPALLLLVLVVSIPFEAEAQRSRRNSVEVTPFVGYRFSNTLTADVNLDGVNVSEQVKLKNGVSYGFIVDVPLTDYIGIEALYTRRSADIEVTGLMPAHTVGQGDATYIHGGAKFTLNPYSRGAKWFLAATMGVGQVGTDVPDVDSQSKFSFGFGAGATIPLSDSIGIRTEFRGFSTKTDLTSLGWICGYYTCSLVQGNQYFWEGELRAGIEFGF